MTSPRLTVFLSFEISDSWTWFALFPHLPTPMSCHSSTFFCYASVGRIPAALHPAWCKNVQSGRAVIDTVQTTYVPYGHTKLGRAWLYSQYRNQYFYVVSTSGTEQIFKNKVLISWHNMKVGITWHCRKIVRWWQSRKQEQWDDDDRTGKGKAERSSV